MRQVAQIRSLDISKLNLDSNKLRQLSYAFTQVTNLAKWQIRPSDEFRQVTNLAKWFISSSMTSDAFN